MSRPATRVCRAADGMEHHLLSRHSVVVQEAPELHLSCPPTRKALDTGAGALNEGSVQGDPPFSRRRSPNRPSPNSIDIAFSRESQLDPRNQPPALSAIEMCAYDRSAKAGRGSATLVSAERIGIGGSLTTPPLPHHRTYGSV